MAALLAYFAVVTFGLLGLGIASYRLGGQLLGLGFADGSLGYWDAAPSYALLLVYPPLALLYPEARGLLVKTLVLSFLVTMVIYFFPYQAINFEPSTEHILLLVRLYTWVAPSLSCRSIGILLAPPCACAAIGRNSHPVLLSSRLSLPPSVMCRAHPSHPCPVFVFTCPSAPVCGVRRAYLRLFSSLLAHSLLFPLSLCAVPSSPLLVFVFCVPLCCVVGGSASRGLHVLLHPPRRQGVPRDPRRGGGGGAGKEWGHKIGREREGIGGDSRKCVIGLR